MKNLLLLSVLTLLIIVVVAACRKKESGICYCSFYSGDRTHYDLRDLDKQTQKDSCATLNSRASNFAGSCKLKK